MIEAIAMMRVRCDGCGERSECSPGYDADNARHDAAGQCGFEEHAKPVLLDGKRCRDLCPECSARLAVQPAEIA